MSTRLAPAFFLTMRGSSLLRAIAGGSIGLGLAYGGIAALARFGPSDMPRLQMIAVDTEVLAYAFAASLVSALLFGLAPAVRLARTRIGETLKEGARSIAGSPHQRTRRVLAAVQLALAFVLVVSSGLLLRSFLAMSGSDPVPAPSAAPRPMQPSVKSRANRRW